MPWGCVAIFFSSALVFVLMVDSNGASRARKKTKRSLRGLEVQTPKINHIEPEFIIPKLKKKHTSSVPSFFLGGVTTPQNLYYHWTLNFHETKIRVKYGTNLLEVVVK